MDGASGRRLPGRPGAHLIPLPELRPPVVVLVAPQLAENIGSVARVMANFGLSDLRLVRPRAGWPQKRAWATASGADWVLDDLRLHDTTADAIADLRLVYAATARPRETRQPVLTPRGTAEALHDAAAQGWASGLMFGGERTGLETPDIALAQGIVTIPIDPRHQSLNLAQAVAVTAYEWRARLLDAPPPAFREGPPPAEAAVMQGVYDHLERELSAAGFFHPPEKTPTMVRNLRVALGRARFNDQEAATFHGVITALSQGRGRMLAKLVAARGEAEP